MNKSRNLTCREAEALIGAYLNNTISDRDKAAFLKHIDNCDKCYEELETDFMVNTTVRYLNEDSLDRPYNLQPLLKTHLKKSREELVGQRRLRIFRIAVSAVTGLLFLFLILDLTGAYRIFTAIRSFLGF
uniref:zf-HC2 domain-containing protein n=1 Tax=Eubacterium cellulosolvens TaxID=29322 RepID=UPI001FA7C1B4|nr:zf-HC2 domain-containing protein [[Eubacterium] cellulosolvens]